MTYVIESNIRNLYYFYRWQQAFAGEGGLTEVAHSYKKFGLHAQANGDIHYREWAPSAQSLTLVSPFISTDVIEHFHFLYSLEISTTGIEMSSTVRKINLECGRLL